MSKLGAPHFTDETAAITYLKVLRWSEGPVCPHCGTINKAYATERPGRWRYATTECRKDFSIRVGTVLESSHVALHKWLLATYLLCSSKKGMSVHQLHRMLDVTYKTTWFMAHRLRETMRTGTFSPMGGFGKVVEADETYIGRKEGYAATLTSALLSASRSAAERRALSMWTRPRRPASSRSCAPTSPAKPA